MCKITGKDLVAQWTDCPEIIKQKALYLDSEIQEPFSNSLFNLLLNYIGVLLMAMSKVFIA